MQEKSIVGAKAKKFAFSIITLYKFLSLEKNEYVLAKQILRSGTSIGANIAEAERAESSADFYHKLAISLKEANETAYWLELLQYGEYIDSKQYNSLSSDCEELIKMLVAITKNKK